MTAVSHKPIGFIGQGWIGKNYADDFERRGYDVVRYSLEPEHVRNKEAIKECEIVFIAVPTPTTTAGFVDTHVRDALSILTPGTTAVIKSTLAVGTTNTLQDDFPDIAVFHSPEFLRERSAAYDAANPGRNLVGIPKDTTENRERAEAVLAVLPIAPYTQIMDAKDAELVKYAGNCFLYMKVLYMNILYDLVQDSGGDWSAVREAFVQDARIGTSHTEPVHTSGHVEEQVQEHRGAGGHCFIKDFEAFRTMYETIVGDKEGGALLAAASTYNRHLLESTGKDIDLLQSVFGGRKGE